jgi:hypothetical protein
MSTGVSAGVSAGTPSSNHPTENETCEEHHANHEEYLPIGYPRVYWAMLDLCSGNTQASICYVDRDGNDGTWQGGEGKWEDSQV